MSQIKIILKNLEISNLKIECLSVIVKISLCLGWMSLDFFFTFVGIFSNNLVV